MGGPSITHQPELSWTVSCDLDLVDDRSSSTLAMHYAAFHVVGTMSIANKAVWIIERNSGRDLSLNGIAQACGVSRSHLANAFGAMTGFSVMHYLRARRLSEAAQALAGGAPDILEVALEAGYASHEAFTRAFREQFGVTPERVRERSNTGGLPIVAAFELKFETSARLEPPRHVDLGIIRVVGLLEPFSWEQAIRISAQWQRFMPFADAIGGKSQAIPVGVCFPPNDEGTFEYLCAVEVSRFADHAPGLVEREIAPAHYAVFEHRLHISRISETYMAIWNRVLPEMGLGQTDAPVLERHNERFNPRTGEGGVSIWVPLAH